MRWWTECTALRGLRSQMCIGRGCAAPATRGKCKQHTFRTRLAPRRNPCADTARLSASNSQTRSWANLSDALVERISRWPTLQSPSVGKEAQLTCLVLQLIQTLSSLRHLCDVFSHNSDCVVNLLLDGRSLGVASRRAAAGGSTTSARDIWIVGFRPGYP